MSALVVSDAGRALRARLDPAAWVVLEELWQRVPTVARYGDAVVAVTVRELGAAVGVSKDTAARALARLTRAGLLAAQPTGARATGRFGPGRYRLTPTDALAAIGESSPPASRARFEDPSP